MCIRDSCLSGTSIVLHQRKSLSYLRKRPLQPVKRQIKNISVSSKSRFCLLYTSYSWSGTSLTQKDLSLNKKGKISKWGTLTLLRRADLYIGKNSEALQAAEEAIKGSEANKYQLWNTEE